MNLWAGTILLLPLAPLLVAVMLVRPKALRLATGLLPLLPLPGVLAAFAAPEATSIELSALVLGLTLGLDQAGRVFLIFTAMIWCAVGWHLWLTRPWEEKGGRRFLFCYLVAMSGNFGVLLSLEYIAYYVFFSMLSFAAYGIVVTRDDEAVRKAGRLYLALAILGEMAMLGGFMLAAAGVAGLSMVLLLYFGMGVKHAVLPLHVWLPRAHGTAPTPASALLSSTLLKAGLLGWMRFMPLAGNEALSAFAAPMLVLGLGAAFYGALCGVLQDRPKMLLGYSSVSQMGIATAAFAIAAASSAVWEAVAALLLLFVLHHALVKAALFLSTGVRRRGASGGWVWPVLLLLSLALVGVPGTGGYFAKAMLESRLEQWGVGWAYQLLPLTSIATALLMARFLWLMRHEPGAYPGVAQAHVSPAPFLALSVLALLLPWGVLFVVHPQPLEVVSGLVTLKSWLPPTVGIVLGLIGWWLALRGLTLSWRVPPGDIVLPLEHALERLVHWPLRAPRMPNLPRLPQPDRVETALRRFSVLGICYLLLLLVFAVLAGALRGF